MLTDTHAHLFWQDFGDDLEEVVARARQAGVGRILNLGTDARTSRLCVDLAERFPECWAAVGLHPGDAQTWAADPEGGLAAIRELTGHPRVVAIGESGLDFYRGREHERAQHDALERQFVLARETGLPIVLHNRSADEEIRDALERLDEGVTAVLHAFTGDTAFGRWAIARGHYLGLGGIFTFGSSDLHEQVTAWDPDHLLLETDSPFLAPVPHRGSRNEPAFLIATAASVATTLGMTPGDLAALTSRNAERVFGFAT